MPSRTALSLCIAALPILLLAQEPSSRPDGQQFVQRSVNILGAQTLNDITLSGTVRRVEGSEDETGIAVLKAIASIGSRIELSLASGKRTESRANSPKGLIGYWSGPDGATHSISYHNLLMDQGLCPAFTLANFALPSSSVVQLAALETRDGQPLIHLTAYHRASETAAEADLVKQLSTVEIFMDAQNYLPVAFSFKVHPDNNALVDIPVEIRFSDYRDVGGAKIPFRVQKFLNDSLTLDMQFQTASTNAGLSEAELTAGFAL